VTPLSLSRCLSASSGRNHPVLVGQLERSNKEAAIIRRSPGPECWTFRTFNLHGWPRSSRVAKVGRNLDLRSTIARREVKWQGLGKCCQLIRPRPCQDVGKSASGSSRTGPRVMPHGAHFPALFPPGSVQLRAFKLLCTLCFLVLCLFTPAGNLSESAPTFKSTQIPVYNVEP
jgi:hypothetical protein